VTSILGPLSRQNDETPLQARLAVLDGMGPGLSGRLHARVTATYGTIRRRWVGSCRGSQAGFTGGRHTQTGSRTERAGPVRWSRPSCPLWIPVSYIGNWNPRATYTAISSRLTPLAGP
jgi:hypothetical protein